MACKQCRMIMQDIKSRQYGMALAGLTGEMHNMHTLLNILAKKGVLTTDDFDLMNWDLEMALEEEIDPNV